MTLLKKIAKVTGFFLDYRVSLKEAMLCMQKNGDGSVVLIRENLPIAILTESDIVNALGGKIDLSAQAYEIATTSVICVNQDRPVEFAFNFLSEHDIRRLILVDDDGNFSGVVLQEDLFSYLEEDVYKVDLKISHIIKSHQNIITLSPDASLQEALNMMQYFHIGSVIIKEKDDFIGILTEKDILKLTYMETDMHQNILPFASSPVISTSKEQLVTDVIKLMHQKHIRRIVVTDHSNKMVAILTNRDILKYLKGNYSRILQIKIKHAQEIMDFLPEAIIEIFDSDRQQVIYWMNKKAKEIFGEGLVDKELTTIFKPSDWKEIYIHFQKETILNDKRVVVGKLQFDISGTLSKNLNNRYIKLIFKNVTAHEKIKQQLQNQINTQIEKRLENEYLLMQQSKLATMGEMIGHIAHQWRQPLAQLGGIFMNLDAAYAFGELGEDYLKEKIKNGNDLIKYMSHTIDDFRHFFAPNHKKELFDLQRYIQSAINIIQASLTYYRIGLDVQAPKESIYIIGYPSEFAQVILNLLDNAKDVLLEREIKEPKISIEIKQDIEHTIVCIKDNAGGIDKNYIDKLFDIYFTTKKDKGGSGLGLYMSRLIVESKMQGKIKVSNTKEGACFCIYIPLK